MRRWNVVVTLIGILTTILFGLYYTKIYKTRDLTPPEITADEVEIQTKINFTPKDLMQGIHAIDEVDGDVTDSLLVESMKMVEGNVCNVTYAACDHSNNVEKFSRYVELTDYTKPRFAIHEALRFPLWTDNTEIASCFSAEDCIDGDISTRIKLEDNLEDMNQDGIYNVNISVTNSIQDNVILPVAVELYSDSYERRVHYPDIVLTEYLVYIEQNSEFRPKMYLDHLELGGEYYVFSATSGSKQVGAEADESDAMIRRQDGQKIDGTIHLSAIKVNSDLDLSVPGTYTVTFSCTTEDKYFGSTQMTVIVV